MTLSYIDADPLLATSIGSHRVAARADERLESERHARALTPAQRARAARLLGVDLDPERPPSAAVLARVPLGAAHRRALQRLDVALEELSDNELRGLGQLLDGLAVVAWDRDRAVVSRRWLVAWCAAHDVDSDARTASTWSGGDAVEGAALHRAIGLSSRTLAEMVCGVLVADVSRLGQWPRSAVRAAASALGMRAPESASLGLAAGRLRGGVARAAGGSVSPQTWAWLAHGAVEGGASWQPLLWATHDEDVLALALRQVAPHHAQAARNLLIDGLGGAGDASVGWALEALEAVPCAVLRALAESEPLDIAGLVVALQQTVAPVEADTRSLVDGPAESGTPPWPVMLGLSVAPRLVEAVAALVGSGTDWVSFDAPGEGNLPRVWSHLLVLAGRWDSATRAGFVELGATGLPAVGVQVGDLAAEWPSADDALAGAGTVSSFAHGLHDGVQEAYGGEVRGGRRGDLHDDD